MWHEAGAWATVDALRDAESRFTHLSERERQVVRLCAEGYNGPEIGHRLGITAKTVDTYKQRIEQKLGIRHRSDYVQLALAVGLLVVHE